VAGRIGQGVTMTFRKQAGFSAINVAVGLMALLF
jgi:hypothetical protein